jgi:D-beta-D-heptose 7-phosphate kinase/D-beta-D-heptose 1-phosphate adenosyltransferase
VDNGLARYNDFLEKVRKHPKRIMVIGDKITDRYAECTMTKIAPEGGAPVLDIQRTFMVPGGAANVAEQLRPWNIMPLTCYGTADHKKTRYLANGLLHTVVSRDEPAEPIFPQSLVPMIGKTYSPDAILVADYGKGAITSELARMIATTAKHAGIPLIVDPSPQPGTDNDRRWESASVIKMNREQWERRRAAGVREWMDLRRLDSLVITQGMYVPQVCDSHSMSNCWQSHDRQHASKLPVVDCSGAGDHFSAVLAVGLVHGLSVHEAADFAHEASKLRVCYRRPRPIMPAEVRGMFDPPLGKILPVEEVGHLLRPTQRIVFTNGIFSIFHAGHASLFDYAKKDGDVLVVGINSDASAARVKGRKPLMPADQRARLVASHQAVDFVIVFDEDTPEETMRKLPAIDTLVKGEDRRGELVPGSDMAAAVRFAPHVHQEHCTDWFSRAKEATCGSSQGELAS